MPTQRPKIHFTRCRCFLNPQEMEFLHLYIGFGFTATDAYKIVFSKYHLDNKTIASYASRLCSRLWLEIIDFAEAYADIKTYQSLTDRAEDICKKIRSKNQYYHKSKSSY